MTPNGFPPGPPIPRVATTDLWLRRPFDLLDSRARRHGEPFSIDLLGLRRIVVVVTPDAVKHVFADDGDTSAAGRFIRSLAGLLGDKSVLMLGRRRAQAPSLAAPAAVPRRTACSVTAKR